MRASGQRPAGGLFLLVAACAAAGPAQPPAATRCVTATCHGDVLAGSRLHAPVAKRKCAACHLVRDPGRHRFSLAVGKRELCVSCHIQAERTVVHQALAEGRCTGCHDPHGSDQRFLLREDPAGGLCFGCHDRADYQGRKYGHVPAAEGACIVCHEAHSAWNWNLLAEKPVRLCLGCHADVPARLELTRHPHAPVVAGKCLSCHDPHASDQPAQLRAAGPQVCFSCHAHDAIRRLVESAPRVHGAIYGVKSCASCHSGHGTSLPKLLARPVMDLCLSCHDAPIETATGRRLSDMAALLKDNPDHHGPIRRADCSACHDPHASRNHALLVKQYPARFYAPFDLANYALCFSCHLQELVLVERGAGVTGFRDGQRNLHYLHVHRRKGRTCRACHEVHASKRPFHIRQKVPFGPGGWEIEINFQKLPDGGRCAPGCHQPRTYRRSPATEAGLPPAGAARGSDQ